MSDPYEEYMTLQNAFDFFNKWLFEGGSLPPLLISLSPVMKKSYGFLAPERYINRISGDKASELGMNPSTFDGRTDKEILGTLVHEMVHHWQFTFGKPSRNGYHNKEWAEKMIEVGLYPSTTGQEGGKRTGQKMSHYIVGGDPFDRLAEQFLGNNTLEWQHQLVVKATKVSKAKKKHTYECPDCGDKVWAKPEMRVICGECQVDFVDQDMNDDDIKVEF